MTPEPEPLPAQPSPPGESGGWRRDWPLLSSLVSARAALAALALVATGYVVWQYLTFRNEEPVTAASVAASWNSSIAKLGITPVFPPEEDLHVGDVLAVIEDADEKQALLGKAVRIAHISLREDLKREASLKRPTFSTTAEIESGKKIRKQDNYEVTALDAGDKIRLSLALFPGITINKTRISSSIAEKLGLNLGLSGGRSDVEEINIPVSETYGVAAGVAAARLDIWCKTPETRLYCSDEFVRRVMAFAVRARPERVERLGHS